LYPKLAELILGRVLFFIDTPEKLPSRRLTIERADGYHLGEAPIGTDRTHFLQAVHEGRTLSHFVLRDLQ
jgi:hypothetical protein